MRPHKNRGHRHPDERHAVVEILFPRGRDLRGSYPCLPVLHCCNRKVWVSNQTSPQFGRNIASGILHHMTLKQNTPNHVYPCTRVTV